MLALVALLLSGSALAATLMPRSNICMYNCPPNFSQEHFSPGTGPYITTNPLVQAYPYSATTGIECVYEYQGTTDTYYCWYDQNGVLSAGTLEACTPNAVPYPCESACNGVQCGGDYYTGPTTCVAAFAVCTHLNPYYFECCEPLS